jgi:hypothetical protein
MNKSDYIVGLITGTFIGALGVKLMESFKDQVSDETELCLQPPDEFEELKNALLSHALQVVYPNRDCQTYYRHYGKYLPKYIGFSPESAYNYMNYMNRGGVYNFLRRYMPTQEKQIGFFKLYWNVVHYKSRAENEGGLQEKRAGG